MKDNSDDNWSVDVPVFNIDTGMEDWVGEGDAIDYRSFTLDYAARVSFDLNATDATKFTIWKFDSKTKKLKSLQATTLAKDKTNGNYTFITKNLLLESGTYYFSMESTNAKKGGDATYSVTKGANFLLFDQGDNSDDDYNGPGVTAFDVEKGWEGWVGYGDAIDYKRLDLANAASVTFDLSSSDAGKFTIWSVANGKKKSIQATTLKLDKASGQYKFTTKNQLLQAGTYYISVENTNAKKGGSGDYTVETGSKYVVFDKGDNTDDKYNGEGVTAFEEPWEGWVGYGDAIDYKSLTLTCASSVAFDVSSTDAGKFTIWSLNNGKLKSVQASTLKLDKTSGKYKFTTKNQLLEKGTYYISVENTNAKKGGSGDYTVVKNAKYVVFDKGDNTDDTYNGAGVAEYDTAKGWNGWVGYGDSIDFKSLTLTDAASVTFDVSSTDAGKFTIWTLNKGKLKSIQATTLKLDKASGKYKFSTKNQLLEKGEYYISVENTNAKKGGSGDYAVATGSKYVVFNKGDNSDDWGDMKTAGADGAVGEITEPIIAGAQILADWVGFGDKVDYRAFTLDSKATIAFDVQSSDAAKFTVYELQSKTSKGVVTYSLKSLQGVTLKAGAPATTKSVKLAAGTYYIAMESTNAAKGGNADYTVAVNANSTFESLPMGEGDNEGTEGADLAIVNADKEIGTLLLAGGDDKLLVGNDATFAFAMVDMGDGNDIVNVANGANLFAISDTGIFFGNGNDILSFSGSLLNTNVNMGAGNDTVNINMENLPEQNEYDRNLAFGAGDDVMVLSGGNGEIPLTFTTIDFGEGNDTLDIGEGCKLVITGAFNVDALENLAIAEGGCLVLQDADSFEKAQNKEAFANVAASILNV